MASPLNSNAFSGPAELALDKSFRQYVEGSDPGSVSFWKEYIRQHPESSEMISEAAEMVTVLLRARKSGTVPDKERSLRELLEKVEASREDQKIRLIRSLWFRIAAAGLLMVGLASVWNAFHPGKNDNQETAFHEIIVPLGEKAQVMLPDGTHVWINSDSKFRYPVQFGKSSREVTLEGEAYFDVVRSRGRAFVVTTRDIKVNVLGTAFNVKCYPGDSKTQTIVVRGKVKIEDLHGNHRPLIIEPNEMATLENPGKRNEDLRKKASIRLDRVEPESMVSWKDQALVFAGESFEDLAVKMERWFNVNIRIDDEVLKTERYNGKFVHNETVYQVLEAIKLTTPIAYKVNKDTIIITRK